MYVLTCDLIRKSEEEAVKGGVASYLELMLTAGETVGKIIDKKFSCNGKKIAVVCGNGKNGGDGFVTARYLYEHGAMVTVITPMGIPQDGNALHFYNKLDNIEKTDYLSGNYDIIVDAVFGIGLNRALNIQIHCESIIIGNDMKFWNKAASVTACASATTIAMVITHQAKTTDSPASYTCG
jgi:NAD(P)H-hydrate epimerase